MSARPPSAVVVGLDVGTTAAKAVAFGPGSSWRAVAEREYPLLSPSPGQAVQDPETVVAAALDALGACVAQAGSADVLAVSLSCAMHGLLGLDAGGRPLTPLITWADARAEGEARELRAGGRAADLHRWSGTPVHAMAPLAKLLWVARHEPETAAAVRWWVGLKDLLLLRLTGTLATELSSASATGLLDLATGDWHPRILEFAGVGLSRLPEVLDTTAVLSLAAGPAGRTGLPAGTPVVAGAADGPLGNLGTGATAPGTVGISLGTSAAARMLLPRPAPDPDGGLFSYALTRDAWVVGGAVSNGASVVRWAAGVVADRTTDADLLALAEGVPAGSDGLVMLPYLLPERAPLTDPRLGGAYLGPRRAHGRGHLVRAAVEGVCREIGGVVDRLDRMSPVTAVRATGGALRAPLWRRTLAAALDRPVVVTSGAEGSALGAAALGLLALGEVERPEDGVRLLSGGAADDVVVPDPGDVRALADVGARAGGLLDALVSAAGARTTVRS